VKSNGPNIRPDRPQGPLTDIERSEFYLREGERLARPGFLNKHDLDADALCQQKPGLIYARVVLQGQKGPWSDRPGFDEIGAAVSGFFTIEGSPTRPKQPVIVPICDNVVGWLVTTGILAALRRRAIEGGSYRVTLSLTRTVLWLFSLGIFAIYI
jgi:crotonobetainyl-CoA:carnitine CoA-transferase CaiB-like acyl-CoA transferase